jgi:O-antigen/teichoic acid export membrane protein
MLMPGVLRSAIGHVRTPLYLNAYALVISNLLSSGLGFVFWGIAARLYEVEVVGLSAALTSLLLFVSGVTQLNLRVVLIRLVPESGGGTARLVGRAYLIALATAGAASLVVYGLAIWLGSPWTALDGISTLGGLAFLALATAALSLFNLQDGVIAGLRRTVWVPVENGIYAAAKIGLLLVLAAAMPALGIVVSWVVPAIVAVGVVTWILFRRWIPAHASAGSHRTIEMERRTVLGFIAADSVGALFALASTTLVPVLVVAVAGPEQGAYFAMAWSVVIALNLFPVNMAASMTVEMVHAGERPGAQLRRVMIHMARVLGPILLITVVLAPFILRIFGPAYAENATDLLRIASLGLIPFSINALALAMARVAGRGREILAIQAATALLTLGIGALLLPITGLTGVAIAWLIAQGAVAVVTFWRRLLPVLRGRDLARA